jgi:hypothetical protein
MGRVAQPFTKTAMAVFVLPLLIVTAGVISAATFWDNTPKAEIAVSQSQTTNVKYQGIAGQNALDLLKRYAVVETKHYSFGDLVTAINGTPGNGPKYWSFYVNGKLADVGAGVYVTKDSDQIEWKLQ